MESNWIDEEMNDIDLGDARLKKRCEKILERFAQSPTSPINQACSDWSETKAAYRFFQNDKVNYKEITNGHHKATAKRTDKQETILAVQDTTYFTYTNHPATNGLCPLSRNRGKHKNEIPVLGLIMHSTLAINCDGLPLGVCNQKIYSRPKVSKKQKVLNKRSHNANLPTKKKDNYKWIESLEKTVELFQDSSERIVTICDREADMYDLFLKATELNTHLLVRASQNRTVNKKSVYSEKTGEKLWALLEKQNGGVTIIVDVPKRNKVPARKAKCKISYCDFKLNRPKNHYERHMKELPDINLYAIYVKELKPDKNIEPIDWMLLTTLNVKTIEDALEKVKWYCYRWRIETWHKILKSGLRVEDCRLSTAQRLIRYLALMSIVAWRIFWITLISRQTPQSSCYIFLSEIEWKILYRKFNKRKKFPKKEPTINQCVRWIAQLGGFLARKNDKEPGITYLWRGIKHFEAMVDAINSTRDIYG